MRRQGPQGLQAMPGTQRPMTRPRPAAPGRRWQRVSLNPHLSRRWKAGLTALTIILVLAICGIGSYLIVLDEQKGVQAQANTEAPKATSTPVDISSREVDPEPLTESELFPNKSIIIDPKRPNEVYTLIDAQELSECKSATAGDITKLIEGMGCNQVVRGTLSTPAEGYVVTGGIMNLDTADNAEKAWDQIKKIVEGQKGRFVGYVIPADKNTKALALASSVVGWTVKGHYVAYCVIARSDSKEIPKDDPFAQQIMEDIVQLYLKNKVLEARANDPVVEGSPAASVAPSP
jgi:hypothetical protein